MTNQKSYPKFSSESSRPVVPTTEKIEAWSSFLSCIMVPPFPNAGGVTVNADKLYSSLIQKLFTNKLQIYGAKFLQQKDIWRKMITE